MEITLYLICKVLAKLPIDTFTCKRDINGFNCKDNVNICNVAVGIHYSLSAHLEVVAYYIQSIALLSCIVCKCSGASCAW